jgi:DNA-binding response OmpR family regulator
MAQKLNRTVLVVDDEADVRAFLSAALIEAGFDVVTAEDGFEALERVQEQIPDLISLDLVMPRKSGVKFHRELVKNKKWSHVPILIVTGHGRDDLGKADLKELTMSGPGIYLEKPVKPTNYIAAIKRILKLDATDEEGRLADQTELQSELKTLVDDADTETLKKIREMLRQTEH